SSRSASSSAFRAQHVADAADGVDMRAHAELAQPLAQAVDMDFDRVRADVVVQSVDIVLQDLLRDHAPGAAHQVLQNHDLARAEELRHVVDEYLAAGRVQHQIFQLKRGAQQAAGTAQQRVDPRHQLL